jgi:hypothetical protein
MKAASLRQCCHVAQTITQHINSRGGLVGVDINKPFVNSIATDVKHRIDPDMDALFVR